MSGVDGEVPLCRAGLYCDVTLAGGRGENHGRLETSRCGGVGDVAAEADVADVAADVVNVGVVYVGVVNVGVVNVGVVNVGVVNVGIVNVGVFGDAAGR